MIKDKNKYELIARKLKSEGNNCSNSLYKAFASDYHLSGDIPSPRSVDGLCGTVLTTMQILKELGKEEYIGEYKKLFLQNFGYLTCIDLMRHDRRCSDYIGFSSNFINDCLKNNS